MKMNVQISLHEEYAHRFKVEFHQLVEQLTLSEVVLRNGDLLFNDEGAPFYHTLRHCFSCSFEGMALGLSRVWDERPDDKTLISIPNLVKIFEDYQFFGCQGLTSGKRDRAEFDSLYADPIRKRLRTARTEALAHSVMVGKSNDRNKSDMVGKKEFGVVTGDALTYCRKTLCLLFSLNDQLTMSKWRAKKSMGDMISEWENRHIAFLRFFVAQVK